MRLEELLEDKGRRSFCLQQFGNKLFNQRILNDGEELNKTGGTRNLETTENCSKT